MIHERFDLARWQGIFGAEYFAREQSSRTPCLGITGPTDVCRLEYRRSQLQREFDFGCSVPADLFVFAIGEPPDRSTTKVGGAPYRPANLPWPRGDILDTDNATLLLNTEELASRLTEEDWQWMREHKGTLQEYLDESFPRLRFLAQFNFADSHDLVGPLPGDVLLLFGDYDHPFIKHYEWHPLGLTDLINPTDVPTTGYSIRNDDFACCYGQIYRTRDYPDGERLCKERFGHVSDDYGQTYVFRPKANRIGGMPQFIQGEPNLAGRLIAVLDGISTCGMSPWPWLNVEQLPEQKPVRRGERRDNRFTRTFLDSDASIYLYLCDNGRVAWEDQCG